MFFLYKTQFKKFIFHIKKNIFLYGPFLKTKPSSTFTLLYWSFYATDEGRTKGGIQDKERKTKDEGEEKGRRRTKGQRTKGRRTKGQRTKG